MPFQSWDCPFIFGDSGHHGLLILSSHLLLRVCLWFSSYGYCISSLLLLHLIWGCCVLCRSIVGSVGTGVCFVGVDDTKASLSKVYVTISLRLVNKVSEGNINNGFWLFWNIYNVKESISFSWSNQGLVIVSINLSFKIMIRGLRSTANSQDQRRPTLWTFCSIGVWIKLPGLPLLWGVSLFWILTMWIPVNGLSHKKDDVL